jgi:alkaline phosphatase
MRLFLIVLLAVCAHGQRIPKAKNVILFLADAGGIPTIDAASLYGYKEPQKLFIQSWPQIGLGDTSTASNYVSDSAAGMTAIVTGVKTHNGVISMGPDTVRRKQDGTPLKTLLEYAEDHGLSTAVLTNVSIADATPAACYAHANDRGKWGEIFLEAFSPRFGDGVDVLMGTGRKRVFDLVLQTGKDPESVAKEKGRKIYASTSDVPDSDARPVVVADTDFNLPSATKQALQRVSRNRKGYFLMIEWDAHTDNPERGLNNLVQFDKLIREIAGQVNPRETLLVFTADHSFGLSIRGGKRGDAITQGWDPAAPKQKFLELPNLRVHGDHTGEDVLIAAKGPGSERIRGFMPNTAIFQAILAAYGWKPDPVK